MIKLLLVLLTLPAIAGAQTPADQANTTHLVRAAGMPLNDGTIAPGTITVRIVEGAFTRDIGGVRVDLEMTGGKVESAVTGADGRAEFAHVPIGAQVRASATVDGEPLVSQTFQVPAQSGVRLLLVTGSGAPPEGLPAGPAVMAATTAVAPAVTVAIAAPAPDEATWIAVIRTVLATATLSAFAFFTIGRLRRRGTRATVDARRRADP
jgi:hypothetical protein